MSSFEEGGGGYSFAHVGQYVGWLSVGLLHILQ